MGEDTRKTEGGGDAQRDVAAYVATRDVPCPACAHNLRASDGAKCPECGAALRLEVSADRLAARGWWVAGVLTVFGVATIFYIATNIWTLVRYWGMAGGFDGRMIISFTFMLMYVTLGVASCLFAVWAWQGWARGDRRALENAATRAIGIVAVVGVMFFLTAAMSILEML